MKKSTAVYIVLALLFVGLGVYFGNRHFSPAPAASATSGVPALFAQSLPDDKAQMQPLGQWKGKTLIVNFWAPWCPPCVQEMPELSTLATSLQASNVQVIGIGIDTQAKIAEFAAKHKISYPLYVAGIAGTELARQLGNQAGGLPFTVIIGADGQVKKSYMGILKFDQLQADLKGI